MSSMTQDTHRRRQDVVHDQADEIAQMQVILGRLDD